MPDEQKELASIRSELWSVTKVLTEDGERYVVEVVPDAEEDEQAEGKLDGLDVHDLRDLVKAVQAILVLEG